MRNRVESLIHRILGEVRRSIVVKDSVAYIVDPVFGIVRNRVNSEICKTLIRLNGYSSLTEKIINFIIKNQNEDGSWNEIHPNYNQPSALVTSFVGEALLKAFDYFPSNKLGKSLEMAKDYVLSQEKTPGYFVKSSLYTADHLNVNASCGAFLAQYGERFSDNDCLKAAKRAARRVCDHQFENGAYPYTTDKGTYSYILNVPCIHYQGVTMYYLLKINKVLEKEWIKKSLLKAAKWLSSVQKGDGKFDWSKSGLMFAYCLSGAYAFAFSSFVYVSRWNSKYLKNAGLCLNILERNINGLVLRWEKDSWTTFLPSIFTALKTAYIGDYPLRHRLFRFGYGVYRQVARRRFAYTVNQGLFKFLCKTFKIKASTVEPSKNYPDMFMTSEVLDCLSYSLDLV
ncbi:hypothetical protein DRP04_08550 [Archaeoglobales archaeon]|nr:MAG: hypothetical protein DRP04_08550 [Archaeoglobales archaeon]